MDKNGEEIQGLDGVLYYYDEHEDVWSPVPTPIHELHFDHNPLEDLLPVREVNLTELGVSFTVTTENLP